MDLCKEFSIFTNIKCTRGDMKYVRFVIYKNRLYAQNGKYSD